MAITQDTANAMMQDADKIASVMAGYYAALLSNGATEALAIRLTSEFQSLFFANQFRRAQPRNAGDSATPAQVEGSGGNPPSA